MWNWKNNLANGIEYSRYCASFAGECASIGVYPTYRLCMEWLETLTVNGKPLSEDDKRGICNMLENGKMELEENAREFLKNKNLSDFEKKYY